MARTRHGNNLHPELPLCPSCRAWAWRTGSTYIGGAGAQACYTCGTDSCAGTAFVHFVGIGLAIIFNRRPGEFDEIEAPALLSSWMSCAVKMLRAADINGCIYGHAAPPATMPITTPAIGVCLHTSEGAWTPSAWREDMDLAPAFRCRVESQRERVAKEAS